ncbi:hypothetical protein BJX61DRAFT_102918 [Aspergillus egyptiacus]|nr:hypothetical protein BJX61DRAFT_102918 [Aspergillus egyptiacus]
MSPSPPSTAPGDLESDLLTHLASTHALEDLHSTLLSSLQRHGWTERIRRLSLELLRANRCERFDEVVEAVVASAQGRSHPVLEAAKNSSSNSNGENTGNGEAEGDGFSFQDVDVKIPRAVVEQGVRAIKDVLREVVVIEDDGDEREREREREKEKGKEKERENGSVGGEIAVEIPTGAPGGKGGGGMTGKSAGGKTINGDTSPTKKEKKAKQGKQVK